MADYKLYIDEYRGDSRVDTIPSASGRAGYKRYDTNTGVSWMSDGIAWVLSEFVDSFVKVGSIEFMHPPRPIGQGLLESVQAYFDTYTLTQNLNRTFAAMTTGTTPNTAAGLATHNASGILRRSWNPFLFQRQSLPALTAGDSRFYVGLVPFTNSLIPSSNTPLAVTDAAFLIGYRSTDTNFHIFHNDGTGGTVSVIDTGVAVPAAQATYAIIIRMLASSIEWILYGSARNILAHGSVTTNLPPTTTNLNYQSTLYNTGATSKSVNMQRVLLRSEG